jgi:hypothetical protein
MRASLLFYRNLQKELEEYRLVVNPYDPCIANMVTKSGKQLTVIWHVDDLLALCKVNFELTKFSCYPGKIYGPKLSMHMGKKHNYLRVDMEFNEDGMLDVSIITYLKNVLAGFPERSEGRWQLRWRCIYFWSETAARQGYSRKRGRWRFIIR